MAQLLICPHGHEWEADGAAGKCPVCGAAPECWEGSSDTWGPVDELPPAPLSFSAFRSASGEDESLGQGITQRSSSVAVRATSASRLPQVPGYEILGVLGRGGMGVVYKARQISLNRLVALKMILAAEHADTDELARFRREGEAVAQLHHPNIVQIFEVEEHEGRLFLALEYCEGGSLEGRLAGTPCEARQAAELAATLARAAHYAHGRGIVHRDLKPANILLEISDCGAQIAESPHSAISNLKSAILKITDFGLAKRLDAADRTHTGQVMGTPSYMAPEQAAGQSRAIGPLCDVYALGAILYELLTGRPPFKAATSLETLHQVLNLDPVPPTRLQPETPLDLETICLKCLHKEPARRYASAQELAEDLDRFLNGRPILARPVSWWERGQKWARRRPALAVLIAVSVLAVAALTITTLIYSTWLEDENERYLRERDTAFGAEHNARLQQKKAEESSQKALLAEKEVRRQQERTRRNLKQSMVAVDKFLTGVGEMRGLFPPHMEAQRAKVFEDALAFCDEFLAENRDDPLAVAEVGQTLRRRAQLLRYLRRLPESDAGFLQTLAFWQTLADSEPGNEVWKWHVAECEYHRGHLQRMGLNDTKTARECYERARDRLQALVKQHLREEYEKTLAWCLHDLAHLYQETGFPDDARRHYDAALRLREKLHHDHPANLTHRLQSSQTLGNFGLLEHGQGNFKKAEEHYQACAAILRQLHEENPQVAEYGSDLGVAYLNLARLYSDTKRAELAEPLELKALDLFLPLYQHEPSTPRYRERLAMAYHNLANTATDKEQHGQAEDYARKAVELNASLYAEHSQHLGALRALAANHLVLADIYQAMDRGDDAERSMREGLRLQQRLVEADPATVTYAFELGKTCFAFAVSQAKGRKITPALEWCSKGIENLERFAAGNKKHPEASMLLKQASALKATLLLAAQFPADTSPPRVVLDLEGKLTQADPKDRIRAEHHRQVHDVKMRKGEVYRIDLASDEFDAFLRIEDARGKPLAEDDDGGGLPHAQLVFQAREDAAYRIIVTTEKAGETGKYRLSVLQKKPADGLVLETSGKLKDDPRSKRPLRTHTVWLNQGSTYQIDLRSLAFDAYLLLRDRAGKTLARDDDGGGLSDARILFKAPRSDVYQIVVTAFKEKQTGDYLLVVRQVKEEQVRKQGCAGERSELPAIEGRAAITQQVQLAQLLFEPIAISIIQRASDLIEKQISEFLVSPLQRLADQGRGDWLSQTPRQFLRHLRRGEIRRLNTQSQDRVVGWIEIGEGLPRLREHFLPPG